LTKTLLIHRVSRFNLGELGALLGGELSPPKPPRGDGTGLIFVHTSTICPRIPKSSTNFTLCNILNMQRYGTSSVDQRYSYYSDKAPSEQGSHKCNSKTPYFA